MSKLQKRIKIIFAIYNCELMNYPIIEAEKFLNTEERKKYQLILKEIILSYNKFKSLVSSYFKTGWKWERISPLERAILIYGAWEMLAVDKPLVINEMVKITKIFIPGKNYKFINSILDKVRKYYEQNKNKRN